MRKFIVVFKDKYLVKTPYWNGGTWTDNKGEATVYGEHDGLEFFPKFYPQFTVVEITDETV